jgi:peptidoglycan hydrolase CwlO-like protein
MKVYGKKRLFLIALVLGVFFLGRYSLILADDCDNIPSDEDHINDKITCLNNKVVSLSSQASTLKNQIAQFDAQIRLTTLKISQTQAQIDLLAGRIDQLEVSLNDLTKAFSSRAVETYKLSRFENNFFFILSATDISDATQRFHYLQKIEEEDRNLLKKLTEAQTTYQGEKQDQETLQKQLAAQKASLNSQKVAKNNLLAITKNDEAKYQSLLIQARAQLESFQSFVESHGGAALLDNQTKCNEGWSGCYYNQRDSKWGNMHLGSTSFLMKYSGCFVTSVAMLASHSGKDIEPDDIAALPGAFTGGDVNHDFDVNNIHVHIDNADRSTLDSKLDSGPVMAELYGGSNQHFIVILRKEGDNYIMNDPLLENGYNKPLSAGGYSYANIVSLRLVSFN